LAWKDAVLAREDQRERKREVLLREAAALINKRGFHATSLEEIAIGLGVTKTALYYYFPNKQKLLSACMDRVMKVAFEAAEEAKARGSTGREKLMLALQLYLEKLIDEMSCCVIVSEESSMLPEDRIAHQKQRDKYDTIIRNLVKEGIKVDVADIGFLSPYLTSNIKRFGDYKLNLERLPEAWIRDSLFAGPAHSVRKPRHA